MKHARLLAALAVAVLTLLVWIFVDVRPPKVDLEKTATGSEATEPPEPGSTVEHYSHELAYERTAVSSSFVVRVQDHGGAPVAGATAVLTIDEPSECTTDELGEVVFPASDRAGELQVSAPGFLPVEQDVERCSGTHFVTLGVGEVLDGAVEVDGRVPSEPIVMTLRTADHYGKCDLVTDELGAFSLKGLPQDWSGSLEFPPAYRVVEPADSGTRLQLLSPQRHLRIRLSELPSLRARLLRSTDSAPLASAGVTVLVRFDNGSQTPSIGSKADDEGRIRVPLTPSSPSAWTEWLDPIERPQAVEVALSVSGADARTTDLEFRGAQIPPDLNLGDLSIECGIELWVRVQGPDNSPIAGALVSADGDRGDPTDAEGVTRVLAESRQPELWAAAVGFRFGPVTLVRGTGTREDPLILELAPGSLLLVRARDPQGQPVACSVQIEGSGWRIPDNLPWIYRLVEMKEARSNSRTGMASMTVVTDENGEAAFPGLAPNVEIQVRVVDAFQAVLVEQRAHTPPEIGTGIVELTVASRSAQVGGVVLDYLGKPAQGAHVLLRHSGSGRGTRTDADGRFEFEGLHAVGQKIGFLVQHVGHAAAVRDAVSLQGDLDLRFDLERGFTVHVSIVDPAGHPVDGRVAVQGLAELPPSRRVASGVYRVSNVPAGMHEFVFKIGTRRFSEWHDPRSGDLRIEVPASGQVEVDVSTAEVGEHDHLSVALAQEGERVHVIHPRRVGTVYRSEPVSVLAGRYTVIILKDRDEELGRSEVTVVAGEKATIRR